MTNGNIPVSDLVINRKTSFLTIGSATVNGNTVLFTYDHKADKMQGTSLMHSQANLYMQNPPKNWMYLVCGSIAHSIKVAAI